jgi:hypothetical protein
MGKFDAVIETYRMKGVRDDNIEYIITSIKSGTKREFILESLTADYRGMKHADANEMLDAFYEAYGGEFKQESKSGYLVGFFILTVGLLRVFFRVAGRTMDEIIRDPWDILVVIGIVVLAATYFFVKAYRGNFREKDSFIG